MKMTLMGTGTSQGVPAIGCTCKVCTSSDPRANRLRCSAYVVHEGSSLLIDVGPEFRLQALQNHITHLDAVLITHSHADHLHGLDDLRIFSHTKPCDCDAQNFPETEGNGLPIYANAVTLKDIRYRFGYLFKPVVEGGGVAKLDFKNCEEFDAQNPILLGELRIIPVPIQHGSLTASGWLLSCPAPDGEKHSIAYLTDCNAIPDKSFALIQKNAGTLEHLIIDGLRVRPHSTHFSFDETLAAAEKVQARHTWVIHMNHDLSHEEIQNYIDEKLINFPNLEKIVRNGGSVCPAYDRLELEA